MNINVKIINIQSPIVLKSPKTSLILQSPLVCFLAMFPSGIKSQDIVYRTFTMVNFFFFSIVASCTIFFHNRPDINEK